MKRQTRGKVNPFGPNVPLAEESTAQDADRVEEDRIIQQALGILETRCCPGEPMCSPETVSRYLRLKLGNLKNECFAVLYTNARQRSFSFASTSTARSTALPFIRE